eukprot:4462544-Alexandrium_andersonii.AAC.1
MRTGLPCERGHSGSPRREVMTTVAFGSWAESASIAAVRKSPALHPISSILACRASAPAA